MQVTLAPLTVLALTASFVSAAPAVTRNGVATYYYQNGAAGSCGKKHSDNDYIVALSRSAPFEAGRCGRFVQITNKKNGKFINALVADTCPGCDANHLDLSTGAFKALSGGQLDPPGVMNIKWHFTT